MNIFITRLKTILRSKGNIFWTFLFPCILGTFFYFGFANLGTTSTITTINVFIASENSESDFVQVMSEVMIDEDTKLFNVNTEYERSELENYLQDDKLTCYVYSEMGKLYLRLNENGFYPTIIKSFLDQYLQTSTLILEVQTLNPEKLPQVLEQLANPNDYLQEITSSTNDGANAMVIFYYALIAMACLFASYWGIRITSDIQANMSSLAARVNITPTHKFKLLAIYVLAAQIVHFIGNITLIFYLKYALGVEFGDHFYLIILASFIGTFSGITVGAFLSTIIKLSDNTKEGIATGITLLLSGLAGLYSVDVKYYVDKYIPFLRFINPTSLLTDTFNSLYYFNSIPKYFMYLSLLLVLSLILALATFLLMRGKKYDSI